MGGRGSGKSLRLSESSRCTRCGEKWRQSKLGLCRSCEHELGIAAEGNRAREQEKIEREAAKAAIARSQISRTSSSVPRLLDLTPSRVSGVLKDVDYIVVWDGSCDGAVAMGRPMAKDKKASVKQYERGEDWVSPRGQRTGPGLRYPGAFENH